MANRGDPAQDPEDIANETLESVSQVVTNSTRSSNAEACARAKLAKLRVKVRYIEEQQRLQFELDRLTLQAHLEAAAAEVRVYGDPLSESSFDRTNLFREPVIGTDHSLVPDFQAQQADARLPDVSSLATHSQLACQDQPHHADFAHSTGAYAQSSRPAPDIPALSARTERRAGLTSITDMTESGVLQPRTVDSAYTSDSAHQPRTDVAYQSQSADFAHSTGAYAQSSRPQQFTELLPAPDIPALSARSQRHTGPAHSADMTEAVTLQPRTDDSTYTSSYQPQRAGQYHSDLAVLAASHQQRETYPGVLQQRDDDDPAYASEFAVGHQQHALYPECTQRAKAQQHVPGGRGVPAPTDLQDADVAAYGEEVTRTTCGEDEPSRYVKGTQRVRFATPGPQLTYEVPGFQCDMLQGQTRTIQGGGHQFQRGDSLQGNQR